MVAIYDKELDSFIIPSKSQCDRHYMVYFSSTDLKWRCDCLGFYYSDYVYCRHIDLIKYYLKNKPFLIINFEPENALINYNKILEIDKREREMFLKLVKK